MNFVNLLDIIENPTSNLVIPNDVVERLKDLEAKIMVGGENLLEKAELQERLLAESEAELQERKTKELQLQSELEQRQAEIIQIEESYGTLQEEITALNKKMKKVNFA